MIKMISRSFIYGILNLFFCFLFGNESSFLSLEEEYNPNYCLQLEAAYGEGMMSEGGIEGIEHMFNSLSLEKKTALDIGSGLGGVAFYLADKYSMKVTGLEVNAWMVEESKKRIPFHLKEKVDFYLSCSNSNWAFSNEAYDIIYSKGVLTHVESKDELFQECYRILKKGGYFVITDWLSSEDRKWGEHISQLVKLENLVLFPETKNNYLDLLEKNGFKIISVFDDSSIYHRFNMQIIDQLQNKKFTDYSNLFDEAELQASIEGYESIAKAIEVGELKVFRFVVQKE